ncbi:MULTISPECIES: lipoprotein [unclassified Oleiphilus]|uniref:lipoprotein n=6 Tax=Oleiphilus TaxID=141450 RepID=UPI000AB13F53|nr:MULTISPECIES: lipoprotein [unclassified Oleiphilus]
MQKQKGEEMKRMFLGFGILAILSGCASNPLENPTAQSCAEYYKAGDKQTAEAVCGKISSRGNSDGYYYLSKIEHDKGNELKSLGLLYNARRAYSSEYKKAENEHLERALSEKKNKNYGQAKEIFELLASHNNVRSQRELGNIYYYGLGVAASTDKAVFWFRKASTAGDQYSKNSLNTIFADDYKKGLKLYESKKFSEALQVWLPIAKEGHYDAQGYLGDIYRLGKLGTPDYSEAAKWYNLAADQDGAYEAYQLALLLKDGKGVSKNTREAYKYFKKAADNGKSDAYFYVAYFLSEGEGVSKDLTAARSWYEKALSDKPSSAVQNNLALMYQRGEGGEKDLTKAKELFKLAADSGNEYAVNNLKTLENMLAIQKKHPNSPKLFGIHLYGATRDEMRSAIKEAGARPTREKYSYFADNYNSRNIMPGSTEMLVFYSQESDGNDYGSSGDYLAQIQYKFPSSNKWYIDEIKDLLSQKYGYPDNSYGSSNLGEVTHYWYKDGVTIKLERGWPNLNLWLSYNVSDFKYKMDAEIAAVKKAKKMKKYEGSSSAF